MNPETVNIEDQAETNRVDYIIGCLKAADAAAVRAHIELRPLGIEGETLTIEQWWAS